MKRLRRGMIFLSILSLLLCTCAYADTLSVWTVRYNTAAASAGLSPAAYTQDFGYGAYGIALDEGFIFALTENSSTVDTVVISGILSQDRLALVCGAVLYACDSTMTIEAAMAEMDAFFREYGSLSGSFTLANGWVYMLETDEADMIVCLTREELFDAYVAESSASSTPPEAELPSEDEATPSEAPTLPEATQSPVQHPI